MNYKTIAVLVLITIGGIFAACSSGSDNASNEAPVNARTPGNYRYNPCPGNGCK